ncbi:hypothetical protein PRUPE_1G004600 [Prunus persica]|uniref:Uncharacterized protein n=1 Tax=Prunus persica TaxID=3760 RepID=A0A251QQK6_PRUPE|nr:hypothetical protein PRUPE_1G004600 [Prunus persica]
MSAFYKICLFRKHKSISKVLKPNHPINYEKENNVTVIPAALTKPPKVLKPRRHTENLCRLISIFHKVQTLFATLL